MTDKIKVSLDEAIGKLKYLPDRTPEMAFAGGAENAFSEVARFGDAGIFVGFYSGDSEWERHPKGDEIVMALEGSSTLVLLLEEEEKDLPLGPNDLVVVPPGTWHRFRGSNRLKILTVTPEPTEHSLEKPSS